MLRQLINWATHPDTPYWLIGFAAGAIAAMGAMFVVVGGTLLAELVWVLVL